MSTRLTDSERDKIRAIFKTEQEHLERQLRVVTIIVKQCDDYQYTRENLTGHLEFLSQILTEGPAHGQD